MTDSKLTCRACARCGTEPDADYPYLLCYHPDSGNKYGIYIRQEPAGDFCADFKHFEQHPGRHPDGSLKGAV